MRPSFEYLGPAMLSRICFLLHEPVCTLESVWVKIHPLLGRGSGMTRGLCALHFYWFRGSHGIDSRWRAPVPWATSTWNACVGDTAGRWVGQRSCSVPTGLAENPLVHCSCPTSLSGCQLSLIADSKIAAERNHLFISSASDHGSSAPFSFTKTLLWGLEGCMPTLKFVLPQGILVYFILFLF